MRKLLLLFAALALATGLVVGCAMHLGPAPAGAVLPCVQDTLPQCESALWATLDDPAPVQRDELLHRYLSRRKDGWSHLYQDFVAQRRRLRPGTDLMLIEGEAEGVLPPATLAVLPLQRLPRPALLAPEQLLLLFGEAAGYEHLIWKRSDGTHWHLYAADPLRPFLLGLPAVLIERDEGTPLAGDVALEHELRQAFAAARSSQYEAAAGAVDRLRAALRQHAATVTLLRPLYALRLLGGAGLALSPQDEAASFSATTVSLLQPGQPTTAYAEMLRVLLASNQPKEWAQRRAAIEPVLSPGRRAAILRWFGGRQSCRAEPPAIAGISDLSFASTLAGTLAPPSTLPLPGQLTFTDWLPRYRALTKLVAAAGVGWYFAPTLTQKRGIAHGVNAESEESFAAVTAMMQKHIAGLRALQQSAPQRFDATGLAAAWLSADEMSSDAALLEPTLELLDRGVRGKLEGGSEPGTIWDGLCTGLFLSLSLPGNARSQVMEALHQELTVRLRGDLREKAGWKVAGLYALDEIYRQFMGQASEIGFDGDQILRALQGAEVSYPEVARLAQAATLYATLGASGDLDAALLGDPGRFSGPRQEAYQALEKAVAGLTPPSQPPAEVAAEVALWVDGFLSLVPLSVKHELLRRRLAQPEGSAGPGPGPGPGDEDAVCAPPEPPAPPEMQRALGQLTAMRQRLLSRPWYRGKSEASWAPRLRVLLLVLSDGLDVARRESRDSGSVEFAVPTPAALSQVQAVLSGVDSGPFAHLGAAAADVYGLLRRSALKRKGVAGLSSAGLSLAELQSLMSIGKDVLAGGEKEAPNSLLSLLAKMDLMGLHKSEDLPSLCAELSSALYDKGQDEAGEGMLLVGMLVDQSLHKPPSDALTEAAARHHSRLLPLLELYQEGFAYRADKPLDPNGKQGFAGGLRELSAEGRQEAGVDRTLDILQAIGDYSAGKRAQGRAALRSALEAAQRDGLSVPKIAYLYTEQLGTRLLMLNLDLSFAGSLAQTGNKGGLSVGILPTEGQTRELRRNFLPDSGAAADERALRLYVHAAALYTVYSAIDGDEAGARFGGTQLISAAGHLLRLGRRGAGDINLGVSWDARAALALSAQLLAEAGQPLLAAEVWRHSQSILEVSSKDEGPGYDIFASDLPEMLGLMAVPGIAPVIERTRASLRRLEPACLNPPHPVAQKGLSCAQYGVELSLRRALKEALPTGLRPDEAPHCKTLAAFGPANQHLLAQELKNLGQPVESALAVLGRVKTNPFAEVFMAHELKDVKDLPAWLRASMAELVTSFESELTGKPELENLRDFLLESAQTPGLDRHGQALRRVVDYAASGKSLGALAKAALAPDFVSRWLVEPLQGGKAEEAVTALVLQHAASIEAGQSLDSLEVKGQVNILCGSAGMLSASTLRGALCAEIFKLRTAPAAESKARLPEVYRLLSEKTADFQR